MRGGGRLKYLPVSPLFVVSKMKGKPMVYLKAETKSQLNDIIWKERLKTYDEAVAWLLALVKPRQS